MQRSPRRLFLVDTFVCAEHVMIIWHESAGPILLFAPRAAKKFASQCEFFFEENDEITPLYEMGSWKSEGATALPRSMKGKTRKMAGQA